MWTKSGVLDSEVSVLWTDSSGPINCYCGHNLRKYESPNFKLMYRYVIVWDGGCVVRSF